MRFRLSSYSKNYITKQEKDIRNWIYKSLREATKKPPKGDIIPVKSQPGRYRLRVGDYRILFTIEGDYMIVIAITPRGDAYKEKE